jgi:hypothetical protein
LWVFLADFQANLSWHQLKVPPNFCQMFVKNSVLNFRNFSEAIIVETTIKLGNKELSGRPKIVT